MASANSTTSTTTSTTTITTSRHDPYSEIETYLRRAQEEISAVFSDYEARGSREESPRPRTPIRPSPPEGQASPPKIRKVYVCEREGERPPARRLSCAPPVPPRRRGPSLRRPRRVSAPARTPLSNGDLPPPCPPRPDPRLQEWSHTLLRDFRCLVEEELRTLHHHTSPHPHTGRTGEVAGQDPRGSEQQRQEQEPQQKEQGVWSEQDDATLLHIRGASGTTDTERDMGATQSSERGGGGEGDRGGGYKTYTLPRSGHRSISLSGAGAPSYPASATHPDDSDVSCRLLRINPRLSRSHSLDEATALNPWAHHHFSLIDNSHARLPPTPADSSTCASRMSYNGSSHLVQHQDIGPPREGMSAPHTPVGNRFNKVRKTGVTEVYNQQWRLSVTPPQAQRQLVNSNGKVTNGWGTHPATSDTPPTPPPPYVPPASPTLSESSAFTPADVQEGVSGSWAWADQEDACSLTDRPCDPEVCPHCRDKMNTAPCDIQPEVAQEALPGWDPRSDVEEGATQHAQGVEVCVTPPEDVAAELCDQVGVDGKDKLAPGRRSEGVLVGLAAPLSPIDGRRHTLPAPGMTLLSPPHLTFSTSSWETLPPADELEVELEEKPIGSVMEHHSPPSPVSSRSINSSLSSISHLDVHPDHSECDSWPSSPAHPVSHFTTDRFPGHVPRHHSHHHVFPGHIQKEPESPHSSMPEPITGVLQLTPVGSGGDPGDIIFSVTIPNFPDPSRQRIGVNSDSYDSSKTSYRRSLKVEEPEKSEENDLYPRLAKLSLANSVNLNVPETCEGEAHSGSGVRKAEAMGQKETPRPLPRHRSLSLDETISATNRKLAIQSTRASAALDDFMQAVESRIRPGPFNELPSPVSTSSTPASTPLSCTATDISSPAVVLDAFTQTTPSHTPTHTASRASSDTWVSECGCDDLASLEPCPSSLALSATEDDYGEDDDDDDDWSACVSVSSSSPPPTPASMARDDDSSLSLSESLDTLDLNGESGIGTVSTRPSTSPRPPAALDLSGSNLSSEDTGLENSFERQIRRYIPHGRGSRESDHYRRRRRSRHSEQWVRREDQTTQTDPDPPFPRHLSQDSSQDSLRESSEMMGAMCDVRPFHHTHSEPQLHTPLTHGPGQLRGVCSEATLPPLPMPYTPRTLLAPSAPILPTLTEDKPPIAPGKPSRPRHLALGSPHHQSSPSKACSAPTLESRQQLHSFTPATTPSEDSSGEAPTLTTRAQSSKELAELEALEACKWLRAAGFPQYAQMYEKLQFPLDLVCVERDHSFLDSDSLQALFRRLKALNRCAKIRLDSAKKNKGDDSEDEEQQYALSDKWQFQPHSRRWSRVVHDPRGPPSPGGDGRSGGSSRGLELPEDVLLGQFKRSGSERLRDGAKAFLRQMESFKNKKKKHKNRDGVVISGPKVVDEANMEARVAELGCVDLSRESSPPTSSPLHHPQLSPAASTATATIAIPIPTSVGQPREAGRAIPGEESSSLASQTSSSTPLSRSRRKRRPWRKGGGGGEEGGGGGAYSDSECSPPTWRHYLTDAISNKKASTGQSLALSPEKRGSLKVMGRGERPSRGQQLRHTGSLNYGKESQVARENFLASIRGGSEKRKDKESPEPSPDEERHSVYDNVPLIICNKSYHDYQPDVLDSEASAQEGSGSSECTVESRESPLPSAHDDDDNDDASPRRVTVDRWHSFNRKAYSPGPRQLGTQINGFSAGQMLHLRKRALLRLTALMERYCPSNRSGWNWELPKFMRKMKTPDYRERQVFGVPLLVMAQRTGQPLPQGIQAALHYLRTTSLDQVGIFRKPGVRSRIQRLREAHEAGEDIQYNNFGTCDIADMVKTYFRELPEVLLTNKLSEMFIAIFQYLPSEHRLEALQCAVLLLPDESREVLIALLTFLADVAANSHNNQMHASNLAVCLAPSLFHLSVGGSGSSPLRRRAGGTPEHRDLSENKAAHQCLTLMIQQVSQVQCIPTEMLSNCRFTYLEQSQPVCLEDLGGTTGGLSGCGGLPGGAEADWAAYMNACVSALLKEARDRSRGWVHQACADPHVELLYRKVGDGHPLRLWRTTTEVEAPPPELLNRIIRERHLWDDSLLKWRVVCRLDRQAEVFQYMCNSMPPRPPVDYCVLRYWRSDLGRGSCVVVETSVEHPDAPLLVGGMRGIVLASRYLIQPCGSGKSRVTHISRLDMRGRTPEWYNKVYGHISAAHLTRIRQSFQHHAVGPESKV